MTNRIEIKISGKRYSVPYEDIVYFEKNLRKIILHTKKGELEFYGRYCDVMPQLDERFAWCHRSYVLNMREISIISPEEVVLSDETRFRFCKSCYKRLINAFDAFLDESVTESGASDVAPDTSGADLN
ncbi:MAG: LytTR family transcriptional regulator DNA-binding domain-containing protein [Firmicutes bacterium]|nr:LytTR family transcriptional regulator DNA-binding domain-containing protein [Bacillota bacterium]